jgi:NADH:ubiquinone oxidoreductase subunit 6 (subunit J)
VLLEVALVVSSITVLTRKKEYWYFGLILAAAGLLVAGLGFLVR